MANKKSCPISSRHSSLPGWVMLVMFINSSFERVVVDAVNGDYCNGKEVLGRYISPYDGCFMLENCLACYLDLGCNLAACANNGVENTVWAEQSFEL
ncbi:hypothetical protein C5167_026596, partial [Papaver somniferum]